MWEAEGQSFEVHVSLDAIDALGVEIMRGFGAVPKRGAEVGGILLGTIERNDGTVIRVEDFQPVSCGYTRGPSYLLSADERETFERATAELGAGDSDGNYAVGYFRSHTRDGLALAPEDVELMDACFAGPSYVALLVRPFATKASTAGFFFREDGNFQETTPLEFPFRRRELLGEDPPERRPLMDRKSRGRNSETREGRDAHVLMRPGREEESVERLASSSRGNGNNGAERDDAAGYAYATTLPKRTKLGGWMWFPLSFIFLLLGVALGFWAEPGFSGMLGMAPRGASNGPPEFSLALAAKKSGDSLTVQWNGDSAAIRNADRGALEIHDAGYSKTVELDAAQLRGGKLAFQNASDMVSFRLTVYLNSRLSLSETLDWRP